MGREDPEIEFKREELLTPDQMALRNTLMGLVRYSLGRGIDIPSVVPGASPLQEQAFGRAEDIMRAGLPSAGLRMGQTERLLSGAPITSPEADRLREDYMQTALVEPTMREFQRNVLPAIAETYNARGLARGGDFQRALRDAATDMGTNLAAARAGLIREDMRDAAQRVGMGMETGARDALLPINVGLGTGAVQRGIAGQQGAEDLSQWQGRQWWANPGLGFMPATMQNTQMGYFQQTPGNPGWGGALGAGLGGLLLGPAGASLGAGIGAAV